MNTKIENEQEKPLTEYSISWKAPANIALVKYWGKKGEQLPENPSLGLTLKACYTETNLSINTSSRHIEYTYQGRQYDAFLPKIETFFFRVFKHYPKLSSLGYKINSSNTFPHSSGMASSASFFASLALCLTSYLQKLGGQSDFDQDSFFKEASFLARLGSGSATRSLFGQASLWGKTDTLESFDEYAIPFKLPKIFQDYHNSIVIVSKRPKALSSSEGHALMGRHPQKEKRYVRARRNLRRLIHSIKNKDLFTFCEIVEQEALDLHRMLPNTNDNYLLLLPKTLMITKKIRDFRKQYRIPLCFSLDAGPNVHVLYPDSCRREVLSFLEKILSDQTPVSIIHDRIGQGPCRL